jgi:hypothetical protein
MVVEDDPLGYMAGTYLSSMDISYEVLLEAYLIVLVHAFVMWLSYILGHVVDEFMRCSCCTSLMSHRLIYSLCMFGTFLVHC